MIDISHILVVQNAATDLPALARALLGQAGDHAREILFVDNGSTDETGAWLAELARINPIVRVLHCTETATPSLRLNQAAEAAKGVWLHVAEAHSVTPVNLCAVMLPLLGEHYADGAHGMYRPVKQTLEELSGSGIESHPPYKLWDHPLDAVLDGTPPRSLMCRRELFARAGGADDRLALADTALPLRLAAHAQRWLRIGAPLALTPQRLLSDAERLHESRDAFDAYCLALSEWADLSPAAHRQLYRHALSTAWKHHRRNGIAEYTKPFFWHYTFSTWPTAKVHQAALQLAAQGFTSDPRKDGYGKMV